MENNTDIELIPVKITKNNITKIIIETFVSKIDVESQYTLSEYKNILTEVYKNIKIKKKSTTTKKQPSKYNIFIKDEMIKLKKENNDTKNKDLLKLAAKKWQEEKNK